VLDEGQFAALSIATPAKPLRPFEARNLLQKLLYSA